MSSICSAEELKISIAGKQVESASSSLNRFVMKFSCGTALLLEACGDASSANIQASVLAASELVEEKEAVCRVDWSWISNSKIVSVDLRKESVSFQFDPAGPLRISVQLWQSSPFLAFQPYRPAK